ncbi:MAG: hypothetical protein K2K44_06695 [Oscillospiraceae bacterium]|nr:hypothetical protein [Oscillospiraceae bacterium]
MNNKTNEIPQYVIDGLARMLLPEIQKFYESPEGRKYLSKQENDNSDSSYTER